MADMPSAAATSGTSSRLLELFRQGCELRQAQLKFEEELAKGISEEIFSFARGVTHDWVDSDTDGQSHDGYMFRVWTENCVFYARAVDTMVIEALRFCVNPWGFLKMLRKHMEEAGWRLEIVDTVLSNRD